MPAQNDDLLFLVGASRFTLKMDPARTAEKYQNIFRQKGLTEWTESSSLTPMSALKLYFAPGFSRNVWHLLLLVPALFCAAYVMVDLVFTPRPYLPISLSMLGLVVLALLCLRNASGCVRYWSLFLWSGLFLMAAATFCPASTFNYQLFNVLACILLLVFFWSLGRFNWRIGVPLLLLCVAFSGVVFYLTLDFLGLSLLMAFKIPLLIAFVCLAGFLAFYCLCVVLAFSAKELPGFRWLVAGFSLIVLQITTSTLFLAHFVKYLAHFVKYLAHFVKYLDEWTLVYVGCTQLLSLLCIAVGASLFTLKMDPAKLEERLRKATPAKEVDSGI
ncbi:MAG: hypothetical protein M0Q48_00905 [Verrucomicrobia bacterium]|nr:hypothetical protein [Verrucomicrobiota bacterium]